MVVIVCPGDQLANLLEMRRASRREFVAALLDAPHNVLVMLEPLDDTLYPSLLIRWKIAL